MIIRHKLLQILGAPLLAPERHSACDLGARFPWFKKYKNNISLLHLYLVIIKLWHWISFKIGTNHVYFFESVRLSSVRESNFWECLWIQAMQCWAARQVWFSRQRRKLKRLPASHSPRSPTHTIPDSLNPFASFTQLAISHHFWTPASPFCFPPLTFPPGCSPKPGSRPAGQYTSSSSSHNGGHRILPHIQPQLQNLPLSSHL